MMKADFALLYKSLLAAGAELERSVSLLNRINVFPVMDGDTGLNLRTTLNALPEISKEEDLDARSVSLSLLRGACGNSGIILAEFLSGLIEQVSTAGELTPSSFRGGVSTGRERAYRAVSQPREGTMLTIMSVLEAELQKIGTPFTMAEHHALTLSLLGAVLDTPKQLTMLADAGVVDAGALGFYILATGLCLALASLGDENARAELDGWISGERGVLLKDVRDKIAPAYIREARLAGVGQRYCVNLVVEGRGDESYADALSRFGDSVNVSRIRDVRKIHIHTNDPDAVEAAVSAWGEIQESVVQDMRQSLLAEGHGEAGAHTERRPVRVMTDAAASLDSDTAERLGIIRLHNYVNVAGRIVPDHDVDTRKLLSEMKEGAVFNTATATPEDARACLDKTLAVSDRAVYIAVGDAYTPTRSIVEQKRRAHPEGERMVILSSAAASGQQGLVCVVTGQFASEAHTMAETVAYAKKQISTCTEYLFIPDLTYLQRTGRIGTVKAVFAKALSIKPIVGHGANGAVTHCKVKSGEQAVATIMARVAGHPGDGPLSVMVEYTDNIEFAETLRDRMSSTLPADAEVILAPLSSASVVHMGPGTWGVAVTRR